MSLAQKLANKRQRREDKTVPRFLPIPPDKDKTPHSVEAEKAVVCGCLIGGAKTMFVVEHRIGDGEGYFHNPILLEIYRVMRDMHHDNEPIDIVTVTSELSDRDLLEKAGGPGAVTELFTFLPTDANTDYYLDILRDKFVLRSIANMATRMSREASAPRTSHDVEGLVGAATDEIQRIALISGKAEEGISRQSFDRLAEFDVANDPNAVLGHRWLCRGSGALLVGQSGIGKSSIAMQGAILWAQGRPLWGISPVHGRKLKSLFIQAENDEGDMAEMVQGVLRAHPIPAGMSRNDFVGEIAGRLEFHRDAIHTGADFARSAASLIDKHKPDIVWVDPLLSYAGGDISQQAIASQFLRNTLNPIALQTGIIWMLLHHTGKPSSDPKAKSHWTDHDFSYAAFGSSELVNWARAVMVLRSIGDRRFELRGTKRGKRAGLRKYDEDESNQHPDFTDVVYLRHAEESIYWEQIAEPDDLQKRSGKTGLFQREYSADNIIDLIKEVGGSRRTSEIQKLCQDEIGISRANFYRLWEKVKNSPHIVARPDRRFQYV